MVWEPIGGPMEGNSALALKDKYECQVRKGILKICQI